MYNRLKYVLAFALGAAAGTALTWKILKDKYERQVQDEVDAFKEYWSGIQGEPDTAQAVENTDKKEYQEIIDSNGYNDREGGTKIMINTPHVISPDEFGEIDDYETITLIYYADKILTDTDGDPINDIDNTVGFDSLTRFGEYEEDPDTVYVRNDELQTDYEICLDDENYLDIIKSTTSADK